MSSGARAGAAPKQAGCETLPDKFSQVEGNDRKFSHFTEFSQVMASSTIFSNHVGVVYYSSIGEQVRFHGQSDSPDGKGMGFLESGRKLLLL